MPNKSYSKRIYTAFDNLPEYPARAAAFGRLLKFQKISFALPAAFLRRAFLLAAISLSFLTVSCGKRKPPVPPTATRAERNSILTARQQGTEIVLTVTAAVQLKQEIKQINLYRLNEAPNSPNFLSEEDFAQRATQIAAILPDITDDKLDYADALSNKQTLRLRYSAIIIYADGRRSTFTNFALVEPAFNVAAAPEKLRATVSQTKVRLDWEKPAANLDGSTQINLVGYNLYRLAAAESAVAAAPRLLNQTPLTDTFFADQTFAFEQNYRYFVRSVSLANNNLPVESQPSNETSVSPVDKFKPAPPSGVTVAAAPNRLSLFFAASQEPDVIGYQIFRSVDPAAPLANWQKITETPIKTTTFQDLQTETNQKYYYYVCAVDAYNNLSDPSEVVSEVAP